MDKNVASAPTAPAFPGTLRDWFAGMALDRAGEDEDIAPTYAGPSFRGTAERAYLYADAMMVAREARQP